VHMALRITSVARTVGWWCASVLLCAVLCFALFCFAAHHFPGAQHFFLSQPGRCYDRQYTLLLVCTQLVLPPHMWVHASAWQ
jgi:hypothetical protein